MNPSKSRFGPNEKKDLLDRINAIEWYHHFDFGNGIVTTSELKLHNLWAQTEAFLQKVDFRGKTVLDVGCYDGYWSFFAEQQGASYVLATDDVSQRRRDKSGFNLAHDIYQSNVEYNPRVSVYQLSRLAGRQFDIVLFLGVYYHLSHPMSALSEVRRAVKSNGEVIIEGGVINDADRSYAEFYYGENGNELYRKDKSNWWLPSRRCLKDMLQCSYFDVADELYVGSTPNRKKRPREDKKGPWGGIQSLLRCRADKRMLIPPAEYGRMLVRAKPVLRSDPHHLHRPPFGLADFDPRYNEAACDEDSVGQ